MREASRNRRNGMGAGWILAIALFSGLTGVSAQTPDINTNEVSPPAIEQQDPNVVQIMSRYPELESAQTLFSRGDVEGAELQMERAKSKHPELPPAGVLMSNLFAAARNAAGARNALEKSVRDEPNDPEAYVIFATNALQNGAVTDAGLLFQKAAEIAESYDQNKERKKNLTLRAYSGVAQVAELREDWKAAEASLRSLLKVDEANSQAMIRLGRALFNQDKFQDAYTIFQEAHRVDKEKTARPEVNMARLYQLAKNDALAKQLMDKAKERDPQSLPTRLAIAQWALETDRLDEAAENAAAAIQLKPDDIQVKVLEGVLARTKKDFPTAEKAFTAAHLVSPSNAQILNQLAISLAEQDDEAKRNLALEYAQIANKLYGDRATPIARECLVVLAWVLFKQDRLPQADSIVRQTLQAGMVGEDALYFAARILHEAGQNEAALQLLNRALDDNPRLFPNKKDAQELRGKVLQAK